jgi:hypothetical protein
MRVNIAVSSAVLISVSLLDVRLSEGFGLEGDSNIRGMRGHHTQHTGACHSEESAATLIQKMGCTQHESSA